MVHKGFQDIGRQFEALRQDIASAVTQSHSTEELVSPALQRRAEAETQVDTMRALREFYNNLLDLMTTLFCGDRVKAEYATVFVFIIMSGAIKPQNMVALIGTIYMTMNLPRLLMDNGTLTLIDLLGEPICLPRHRWRTWDVSTCT